MAHTSKKQPKEGLMRTSVKHVFMGLVSLAVVAGTSGLVLPQPGHADEQFGEIRNNLNILFPPCGTGTREDRFVVSLEHPEEVCDNTTGLYWQQSPSTSFFNWADAIQHCEDLSLKKKILDQKWRLAEIKEYISLVDYNVEDQVNALNDGPFDNVQSALYWTATAVSDGASSAWVVNFMDGGGNLMVRVGERESDGASFHGWCVRGR